MGIQITAFDKKQKQIVTSVLETTIFVQEANMIHFPMIEKVCDYFDCSVQWDLFFERDTGQEWPCCWLGDRGDPSVGVFPFQLTKSFQTKQELEDWCNTPEGMAYINQEAIVIFPDYPFDGKGVFDADIPCP